MVAAPLFRESNMAAVMSRETLNRGKCNLKYIAVYWYFDISFSKKLIIII